jgi:hypothetical protein
MLVNFAIFIFWGKNIFRCIIEYLTGERKSGVRVHIFVGKIHDERDGEIIGG